MMIFIRSDEGASGAAAQRRYISALVCLSVTPAAAARARPDQPRGSYPPQMRPAQTDRPDIQRVSSLICKANFVIVIIL